MAISRTQGATAAMVVGGLVLASGIGGVVSSIFADKLPMLKNLSQTSRTALSYGSAAMIVGGSISVGGGLIFKQSLRGSGKPQGSFSSSEGDSSASESTSKGRSEPSGSEKPDPKKSETAESSSEKPDPKKNETAENESAQSDSAKSATSSSSKREPIEPKKKSKGLPIDKDGCVDEDSLTARQNDRFFCSLMLGVPRDPAILAEEGNGYSESMITEYFESIQAKTKHKTPITKFDVKPKGGATIIPNRALRDFISEGTELNDPFTRKPFGMAWICQETGYTYNIDTLREKVEQTRAARTSFVCPKSGTQLETLTMYPNYPLWDLADEGLPKPDPGPPQHINVGSRKTQIAT